MYLMYTGHMHVMCYLPTYLMYTGHMHVMCYLPTYLMYTGHMHVMCYLPTYLMYTGHMHVMCYTVLLCLFACVQVTCMSCVINAFLFTGDMDVVYIQISSA